MPEPLKRADPTSKQQHRTAAFFDRISGGYSRKYEDLSPFHRYFFRQRLEHTLDGLDLSGSSVLDIGSGTGALYDVIDANWSNVRFIATDISAGMLENSRVPEKDRFVGPILDLQLPVERFDLITMLGVTSYLTESELERTLERVMGLLAPDGLFIVTFTNRWSLDTIIRKALRWPLAWFSRKENVMTSGIPILTLSAAEIRKTLSAHGHIRSVVGLNHTVFPFNQITPKLALWLASKIGKGPGLPWWKRFFSSDLLVKISKAPATDK